MYVDSKHPVAYLSPSQQGMDAEPSRARVQMVVAEFRVAREYDVVKVKLTKEGRERVERLQSAGCCLGCERKFEPDERVTCGNCATCYNALLDVPVSVRVQKANEGKTLAPGKGGRKPANKFTAELAER